MVLPGIQALFGFQLIAVINEAFDHKLNSAEQKIHLLAIAMTAVACGLSMSPAALHRTAEPDRVSLGLVKTCTTYLRWSMRFLGLALVLDFYLVAKVVLKSPPLALLSGLALGVFLAMVWGLAPWLRARAVKGEMSSANPS